MESSNFTTENENSQNFMDFVKFKKLFNRLEKQISDYNTTLILISVYEKLAREAYFYDLDLIDVIIDENEDSYVEEIAKKSIEIKASIKELLKNNGDIKKYINEFKLTRKFISNKVEETFKLSENYNEKNNLSIELNKQLNDLFELYEQNKQMYDNIKIKINKLNFDFAKFKKENSGILYLKEINDKKTNEFEQEIKKYERLLKRFDEEIHCYETEIEDLTEKLFKINTEIKEIKKEIEQNTKSYYCNLRPDDLKTILLNDNYHIIKNKYDELNKTKKSLQKYNEDIAEFKNLSVEKLNEITKIYNEIFTSEKLNLIEISEIKPIDTIKYKKENYYVYKYKLDDSFEYRKELDLTNKRFKNIYLKKIEEPRVEEPRVEEQEPVRKVFIKKLVYDVYEKPVKGSIQKNRLRCVDINGKKVDMGRKIVYIKLADEQ